MQLASASMSAAGMLNQNVSALQSTVTAVGQNPTAGGAAALAQAAILPQVSTSVLKDSLALEASNGAQLAQMIAQGSGINIQA